MVMPQVAGTEASQPAAVAPADPMAAPAAVQQTGIASAPSTVPEPLAPSTVQQSESDDAPSPLLPAISLPQPSALQQATVQQSSVDDNPALHGPELAQAAAQPAPAPQPVDLTPVQLPERGPAFGTFNNFQTNALYKLPSRMFFSAVVDNSARLETNVFQTQHNNRSDLVYRVIPNILAGYALTNQTRVAANYFMYRDQYAVHDNLSRDVQNFGLRIDHDIRINDKTTLTAGFMGRTLLSHLNDRATHDLTDLLPSLVMQRRVGLANAIYASVLGQIRWKNVFGEFQEGDQFYSVGGVFRKRGFVYWTDLTWDSNFGRQQVRGGPNNQVLILTLEASHRISRRYPASIFVTAQPIYNIGPNSFGYSGFNFRLFGGVRLEIAKPAIFPTKLASK
ncbi:MAG TPA: hypothetical protein V6C69_09605 [Trichormus sp.]